MTEKRKYPIAGTDFFTQIMDDDGYYIDKTDVIPWILARKKRVILFTRPRRFGKSTMISMLKAFFEYWIDRDGKIVDNRHYFENLKVSQDAEAMSLLGAYPVIWITLKDVIQHSFKEALGALVSKVCVMVELCDWAWKNSGFVLDEKRQRLIDNIVGREATEAELANAIALLSGILHDVTNRNVIILIDEYDVPLQSAFLHGYYDEMLTFLRTFMSSALKTNPYLERGVITGCLRVSKKSSLSGLNNVESHTIMSKGKREFFGFEPAEVREMLHYFDLDDHYPMLEYNYDGYDFCGRHAHNPWSVIMCTRALLEGDDLPYRTYWLNTSGNDIIADVIHQNDDIRKKCFDLLRGQTVRAAVSEYLTWKDLRADSRYAWSLLTFSGYLKPVEYEELPGDTWACELAIPNREVKEVFAIQIGRWFSDKNALFDPLTMSDAFWHGDIAIAKTQIACALQCMSYFDSKESFYHGMMLGLLGAANRYIESNIEYGSGRLDIAIWYRNRAFVIELKSVTESELKKLNITREYQELDAATDDEKSRICARLAALADEALQQIDDKQYIEGFIKRHPDVKTVRCYGVAFCRRWVEVAMKG
ncbi:MAG: AAA family ATPase [Proteobacteria bacterium]|nr:AAA family ATPase [Pseudomonadota bacterium]